MTAAEVLARLAATTTAERRISSGSGHLGDGTGTVTGTPDRGAVVLAEAGTWAPEGERPLRWRATSRWHAEGGTLAVVHERQGIPASAVLDRQADGTWVGRAPHVCDADRYAVALRVDAEAVTVTWTVEGPAKRYTVTTRYAA